MQYKIREVNKIMIVGLKIKTSLTENKEPELWSIFNNRYTEVKKSLNLFLGVFPYIKMDNFGDFDPDYCYDYIAGIAVESFDDIPDGMITHTIPASKYAVFTHKGKLDKLEETYQYIFKKWKQQTDLKIKESDQFELYDNRFIEDDDKSEMDIYIPVY